MGEDVAIEAMEEVARVRVDELTRSVEDVCDCPAGEQKTEEAFFLFRGVPTAAYSS